jgi:hypothetical protein
VNFGDENSPKQSFLVNFVAGGSSVNLYSMACFLFFFYWVWLVAGHEPPVILLSDEYDLSFIKKTKEEEIIFTSAMNDFFLGCEEPKTSNLQFIKSTEELISMFICALIDKYIRVGQY